MIEKVQDIALWVAVTTSLLGLGTTVWNILSSGARGNARQIEAQGKRLDDLERRTDRMKAELEQSPSKESIHQLELMMSEMRGQLSVLNERLQPLSAITERMQELLLHNGKG